MPNALPTRVPNAAEVAVLGSQQIAELLQLQATTIATLSEQLERFEQQIEWFKRQLFGSKSERFAPIPGARQSR